MLSSGVSVAAAGAAFQVDMCSFLGADDCLHPAGSSDKIASDQTYKLDLAALVEEELAQKDSSLVEDKAAGSLMDWDDSLRHCSCCDVYLGESCSSLELAYCFVLYWVQNGYLKFLLTLRGARGGRSASFLVFASHYHISQPIFLNLQK